MGRTMLDKPKTPQEGIARILALAGQVQVTEGIVMNQHRINTYAAATLDKQPIHIDLEYAAKSRFRSTIVHGHLLAGMVFGTMMKYLEPIREEFPTAELIQTDARYTLGFPVKEGSAIKIQGKVTDPQAKERTVSFVYVYDIYLGSKVVVKGSIGAAASFKNVKG